MIDNASDLVFAYAHESARYSITPRTVRVTNPAAGADWTTSVPFATTWVVQSIAATLTTSAVVANRTPRLDIADGSAAVVARVPWITNLSAGVAWKVGWTRRLGSGMNGAANNSFAVPLEPSTLPGGYTITTVTTNLDAGDQWSGIALYVLEVAQRSDDDLDAYVAELAAGSPRREPFPGLVLAL